MQYLALHFKRTGGSLDAQTSREILVAELGAIGFESFTETENGGLSAYIQVEDWADNMLDSVQILSSDEVEFEIEKEAIEQVNWNAEWENNFEPIEVNGRVSIRAPFHDDRKLEYNIVIEPKMSFGTGHHETTHLMIEHLLEVDLLGKTVLDMGCGTGILAIFSEMRGAKDVEAIDIDAWCYENSLENAEKNGCFNVRVFHGDAGLLEGQKFDVIIANINRNILLNDMSSYVKSLNPEGILLLSGFYVEDIEKIGQCATELGLKLLSQKERNRWVGLKYVNLQKA
jgi:ribosomal protein L11 methyltransferase